jgi:hypothetical protein
MGQRNVPRLLHLIPSPAAAYHCDGNFFLSAGSAMDPRLGGRGSAAASWLTDGAEDWNQGGRQIGKGVIKKSRRQMGEQPGEFF